MNKNNGISKETRKQIRKNNLYMSGGSDFHGDKKPNNYIGIGNGTLNIPTEMIEQWANVET